MPPRALMKSMSTHTMVFMAGSTPLCITPAPSHPVAVAPRRIDQIDDAQQPGKRERNPKCSNWKAFERGHGAVDDFQRSSRLNPGARLQYILVKHTTVPQQLYRGVAERSLFHHNGPRGLENVANHNSKVLRLLPMRCLYTISKHHSKDKHLVSL